MRPLLFLIALFVAAFAGSAMAKTLSIAGEGIAIDVPDDWKTVSHPGFALATTTPDGKAGITVRILPNNYQAKIDESFYLEAMKRARQEKADKDQGSLIIIEAGSAAINGVPASYIHTEEPMPDGRTAYSRDFLIAANGKFFAISADAGDPFTDGKLNDVIGTFRFDAPPVLPDKERPFYRRFAQVTGIAACIIFLAAFGVWLVIRRRKMTWELSR